MKSKAQKQNDNTFIFNMYSKKFLKEIGWTQKTLKRHIDIMHSMGVILNYKLPRHQPMNIHINKVRQKSINSGEEYTQVDRKTVKTILEITNKIEIETIDRKTKKKKTIITNYNSQGVRLYYYYEKNYNPQIGYAFPSQDTIKKDCKISKDTINILNKLFKKNKILYVEHGKKTYINNNYRPQKENNKYIPLCKGRFY